MKFPQHTKHVGMSLVINNQPKGYQTALLRLSIDGLQTEG